MSKTTEFHTWNAMVQRCTNENHKSYYRYGGRGISVCAEWLKSFQNFYDDMGEKPSGLQLDRIDNNLGYSKDNCRWVTVEANANNRECSRNITFEGETLSVAQWSRRIGSSRQALRHRLERGWSIQDAITVPFTKANRWRNKS
jgi:hypothetical protein